MLYDQGSLPSSHPLSLPLRSFARNSSPPLPCRAELPSCAFCILPCLSLPSRLDLWIPLPCGRSPLSVCWTGLLEGSVPFTDPGCKRKSIQPPGTTSHPPTSRQLTHKQTCWNMSWWHLCHCSEWPKVNVRKPSFVSHIWSGLARAELKHTS